ncbi:hypothetical protein ACIREM_20565 [Streptomyces shenzhenensis]|uniref:hypothetical protein n=1 Tax=Streptomyces shenzhenensis TaxID=943815 RepID=UPI00380EEF2D
MTGLIFGGMSSTAAAATAGQVGLCNFSQTDRSYEVYVAVNGLVYMAVSPGECSNLIMPVAWSSAQIDIHTAHGDGSSGVGFHFGPFTYVKNSGLQLCTGGPYTGPSIWSC